VKYASRFPAKDDENFPMITIPLKNLKTKRLNQIAPPILGLVNDKCYLAGGAMRSLITGETPQDYDLFFSEENEVDLIKEKLAAMGAECYWACPEGKMFSYKLKINAGDEIFPEPIEIKIQLILQSYNSFEDHLHSFDFDCCCCGTDGQSITFTKKFVKSVKFKRLTLNRLMFPVATIKRLVKFSNKGFNINPAVESIVNNIHGNGMRGIIYDEDQMRIYID
jgi:hypothetical protein